MAAVDYVDNATTRPSEFTIAAAARGARLHSRCAEQLVVPSLSILTHVHTYATYFQSTYIRTSSCIYYITQLPLHIYENLARRGVYLL